MGNNDASIWERVKSITWKQLTPKFDSYKPCWDYMDTFQFIFLGDGVHFLRFGEEVDGDKKYMTVYGEFWDDERNQNKGVNNFEKWYYTFDEAVKFISDLKITLDLEKVYRPPT